MPDAALLAAMKFHPEGNAQKIRGRKRPAPAFSQPPAAGGMFPPGPPFDGAFVVDVRLGPLADESRMEAPFGRTGKTVDPPADATRRPGGSVVLRQTDAVDPPADATRRPGKWFVLRRNAQCRHLTAGESCSATRHPAGRKPSLTRCACRRWGRPEVAPGWQQMAFGAVRGTLPRALLRALSPLRTSPGRAAPVSQPRGQQARGEGSSESTDTAHLWAD